MTADLAIRVMESFLKTHVLISLMNEIIKKILYKQEIFRKLSHQSLGSSELRGRDGRMIPALWSKGTREAKELKSNVFVCSSTCRRLLAFLWQVILLLHFSFAFYGYEIFTVRNKLDVSKEEMILFCV